MILAYGPESFASHEFEADRSYTFKVDVPVDPVQELRWVDGQHFLFSSNGVQIMMDFDGSNMYELVNSLPSLGSFYSDGIENLFSFSDILSETESTPSSRPASISVTNLLTPSDR
jgi:hypothetical protein